MAEIAATLGIGPEWEHAGKKYRVSPRTFKHEGLFEVWCEEQALLAIRRNAPRRSFDGTPMGMVPAEYAACMEGWRRDCARHFYRYPAVGCLEMLGTIEGSKYMAYLQLLQDNPSVTLDFLDEVFDAPPEEDEQGNPKVVRTDERTREMVPVAPWEDLLLKMEVQADRDPLPKTAGASSTTPAPAAGS